jgi:YbbR domain-containing protein
MAFLRKWVIHNWHLKLLALVIAFLLWSTFTSEPAAEVVFQLPIELHNFPEALEVTGEPPTQAFVRVRGRATLLRRLTPRDLSLSVDLAGATAGERTFSLGVDSVEAPYGISVVQISPRIVRLRLAPRAAP